jgi:hypothetical protein
MRAWTGEFADWSFQVERLIDAEMIASSRSCVSGRRAREAARESTSISARSWSCKMDAW